MINTSGDIAIAVNTLNRVKKNLPKMVRLGMQRWGRILERDMKAAAKSAGITNFTGTAQGKGIRYEQGQRSDSGFLFMRLYMVYLDSMRPHYVAISMRRTRILAWAKQARSPVFRKNAREIEKGTSKKFSIFVKPHPFIRIGYGRARPKLRPVLKRLAERGIQHA